MKRQQKQPAYRRLTWTDRLIIERLFNNGHSRHFIARELNRSVSSISDEIRHGLYTHLGAETTRRPEHYSAQIAQDSRLSLPSSPSSSHPAYTSPPASSSAAAGLFLYALHRLAFVLSTS